MGLRAPLPLICSIGHYVMLEGDESTDTDVSLPAPLLSIPMVLRISSNTLNSPHQPSLLHPVISHVPDEPSKLVELDMPKMVSLLIVEIHCVIQQTNSK